MKRRVQFPLLSVTLTCAAWVLPAWADAPSPVFRPEPATTVHASLSAPGSISVGNFDSGRADFHVTLSDGLRIEYNVFGLFALPGEVMSLEASTRVRASSADGLLLRNRGPHVSWTAPTAPGLYTMELRGTGSNSGAVMRLNLIVMRPAEEMEAGLLDHYHIGQYPEQPYRGLETYLPPEGFAEVTPEMRGIHLSPHFTLGQFLSKQASPWPKFAFVQARLVLKLEQLLEAVNAAGIETDSFTVMSGYRTPHYNASIGNGEHSRHIFGGAADIFIDVAPQDGVMDDINGDGQLNEDDAAWLYRFIDQISTRSEWQDLNGGLGQYGSTPAHGPFVHVDERGWPARWGG